MTRHLHGALPSPAREPLLFVLSVSFEEGARIFGVGDEEYARMRQGFKRLSRRGLFMAGAADGVIVDREPEARWLELLRAAGGGGGRVVWPAALTGETLAEDLARDGELCALLAGWGGGVEPYMVTGAEERLAEAAGKPLFEGNAQAARLLNDKVFFSRLLDDAGLPSPPTFIGGSDAAASRVRRGKEALVVRAARSVGGSRVWLARDGGERRAVSGIVEKTRDTLFLIQPLLPAALSPNLQFYVGEKTTCLLGRTAQVMAEGARHTGNLFGGAGAAAVDDELFRQGRALAEEAGALGHRGVMGVDFIVTEHGGVFAVEINARHNTSTSALWLYNRLCSGDPFAPGAAGRGAYLRVPARAARPAAEWLAALGPLAFDPRGGRGILPYDHETGELEALIIGEDEADRARLMESARRAAEG